jgi:predicted nucleotidyltransferase
MSYELVSPIFPRTDVFIEYLDEEIKNFDPSIIKFNETLHPKFFNEDNLLKENVRKLLINIVNYFFKSIDYNIVIDTISITGSIVNYNYNKYSDIDLHFIIDKNDYMDKDFDKIIDYLNTKSKLWNYEHENIKMFNHNIEIYIQEKKEKHTSTGVYDLLCNKWINKSEKQYKDIDIDYLKSKFNKITQKVDYIISQNNPEKIEQFIDNIKLYRKAGLQSEGEYSNENIIYKMLKHFGYMSKLYDYKRKGNIENK